MMLSVFFTLLLYGFCSGTEKCSENLRIKITDGIYSKHSSTILKDGIEFDKKNYLTINNTTWGCVCNLKSCIRMCCGKDEIFFNKSCIKYTDYYKSFNLYENGEELISENVTLDQFYILHNAECPKNYARMIFRDSNEKIFIQTNGDLYIPSISLNNYYSPQLYCLDKYVFERNAEPETVVLFCFNEEDEEESEEEEITKASGMIISMPFLLTTFLVYTLLPDRNLHAKALMFYTLSLFFGYLILVIIQLSKVSFGKGLCQTLGFSVQFFFILSFFWMNVICADIWLTFSGHRGFSGGKRSAETKRFILYCLYACGMSFLITLITFLINTFADDTAAFHPNIGNGQCFLRGTWPELLYFYGPMGLILATNIIFFAITAYRIRQAKKDTSVLKKEDSKRHSYENDKQNFNLYLRLLLAMGINWTMELISWAVQAGVSEVPNYVWYVTDFCNAIYGVFIFFLFVFKKKIWKLLKKRYYTFIGKPQLGHFTSTLNQTRTSNYSTAETSLTDNHHHSIHREEIPLRTST